MNKSEQLIACLEGEIASRDVEIERVTANCNALDDQNDQLRAELAAIKAQEPVAWLDTDGELYAANVLAGLGIKTNKLTPLYAAPVSEAKAQVYQCPRCATSMQVDVGAKPAKAHGVVMPERANASHGSHDHQSGWNECLKEVARLNAAPAQQVSVPDGWRPVPIISLSNILRLIDPAPVRLPTGETMVFKNPHAAEALTRISAEVRAMLAAAPAAAAADAGLVAVEWAKDAEEWGPALNEAGWLFLSELNEDPQKSALIFNNTKGPLRAAIMKYAEIVTAHRAKGVV